MSHSRVLRAITAAALLFGFGYPLLSASSAAAAETACADTRYAEGSYELFNVQQSYVPPPLRVFRPDCASRLADRALENTYVMLFTDTDAGEFVDIIRSFEDAGWIDGASISYIDGNGVRDSGEVDSAALASLGGDLQWATARFSNQATGNDIISVTYWDGVNGTNDPALASPNILVDVFVNQPYASTTGFGDPSVLSNLKSIFDLEVTPAGLGVLTGGAVMLMLVVGYPGTLISKVIESRYEQLFGWVRRRAPHGVRAALKKTQPRALVWIGFVVAAIVAGFVDPAFGFNLMSLRVLITGFASFALFNVVAWQVVQRVAVRIEPQAKPVVQFRWGSLLIVLGAVLVARLLEFNPGVIFGLVAGLSYAISLVLSKKAVVVLVGSGLALALGLFGWVGYSMLTALEDAVGPNAALLTVTEFFSGVTIEGISTLPLALLPFAIFDGGTLIRWKKWVWGLAYAVGLAAFVLVLLTIPDSFGIIPGDFARWLLLFAAYAVIALGVWAIDAGARSRAKRAA